MHVYSCMKGKGTLRVVCTLKLFNPWILLDIQLTQL